MPSSFDLLRWSLLGAIGASLAACGGATDDGGGGSGGSSGSGRAGDGGDSGSGAAPGSGSSTGAGGLGPDVSSCTNPAVLDGGFVSCDEGFVHRTEAGVCPDGTPRSEPVADAATVPDAVCYSDEDCTSALAYCVLYSGPALGTTCVAGCLVDADCGAGFICQCASPLGACVAATCVTDADCQDGLSCTPWTTDDGCGPSTTYACQTPGDQCRSVSDCAADEECRPNEAGVRACQPRVYGCAIGRPFLVDEAQRLAPAVCRGDWLAGALHAEWDWDAIVRDASGLAGEARAAVSEHYARAGRLEHASIAAFARFLLELLSLGAPAELVDLTNRAVVDETRHARLCFRIAEIYGGAPVGPGRLDVSGPVVGTSLREIARAAIIEGCVGETVAALEAREAARVTECPALAAVLTSIAEDEERHAELAYRFVRWAIECDGAVAGLLMTELGRALDDATSAASLTSDSLRARGLLSGEEAALVRRRALREVVEPAFESLVHAASKGREVSRGGASALL